MLTEEASAFGVRNRVLVLRSLESFSSLDERSLTLIAEHASYRRFAAGETVCVEGAPISFFHIVIEGQVTVTRMGHLVAVTGRSRGVGILSLLARDPNGVSAVADVDTRTLAVPVDAFLDGLEESFSLVRNSLRLQAGALLRKRGNLPARPDKPPPFAMGEYVARDRTLVERIIDLSRGGVWASCNLDAVVEVARRTTEIRVEPGEVFWKIGDPSSFWLRIDHGRVRCTAADGQLVDVGHRFVLGIMDSIAQQPRSYEARAETRVVAYKTELESFLGVLETHFDLARDFLGVLARALLEIPETTPKAPGTPVAAPLDARAAAAPRAGAEPHVR
jgi:CRP-like cAMP-binding protein